MITITATMTTGTAVLKDDTLKAMVKYMNDQNVLFSKGAAKVHRKTVFEILIFLIRVCPVVTGRLRGSWTPYLDRWGKQSAYNRFLTDKSLVISRTASPLVRMVKKQLGIDEISEGKRQGFFQEAGLTTTVGTNVVYAYEANNPSKYFDRATEEAGRIINANFENYIKAAEKAGWIPPEDFSDEPRPME